ncbi:MAG: stage III sporulation protein AF [Clostridium sp.]
MESITSFIVTLVTALVLITAVELIAPDNSIKKYINFVLGLILISVMLTPIVSFFSGGETKIFNEISKYENGLTQNTWEKEKKSININQNDEFKKSLNRECEKSLKEEFDNKEFASDITIEMDIAEMKYSIEKVRVGVKDNSVKKIRKIEINSSSSSEVSSSTDNEYEQDDEDDIKTFLQKTLKVKSENIELYTFND